MLKGSGIFLHTRIYFNFSCFLCSLGSPLSCILHQKETYMNEAEKVWVTATPQLCVCVCVCVCHCLDVCCVLSSFPSTGLAPLQSFDFRDFWNAISSRQSEFSVSGDLAKFIRNSIIKTTQPHSFTLSFFHLYIYTCLMCHGIVEDLLELVQHVLQFQKNIFVLGRFTWAGK